jgi:hypothetical protein
MSYRTYTSAISNPSFVMTRWTLTPPSLGCDRGVFPVQTTRHPNFFPYDLTAQEIRSSSMLPFSVFFCSPYFLSNSPCQILCSGSFRTIIALSSKHSNGFGQFFLSFFLFFIFFWQISCTGDSIFGLFCFYILVCVSFVGFLCMRIGRSYAVLGISQNNLSRL